MTNTATGPPQGARRAGEGDLALVVELLVDGFADDPFFRWLYPGSTYNDCARAYFDLVCRRIWPRAHAYLLDQNATAIWIPVDRPLAEPDDIAELAALLERQVGDRAAGVLAVIGSTAPSVPPERHATCVYVAVRSPARGQGLGTRVMAESLDECDRQGVAVYLTSTNDRNLPFYERLGFMQLAAPPVVSDGPTLRPMWRAAQGRAW